jgi:hypothetical protein
MFALANLNLETHSDPDYIKPVVQFSPCINQHSFHQTLNCLDYTCMNGSSVTYRCSENSTSHTPQEEI